jgi:hypothetical protein
MHMLKSELLRFFAIGFALGAVVLFATFGVGPSRVSAGDVVPAAVAAPMQ